MNEGYVAFINDLGFWAGTLVYDDLSLVPQSQDYVVMASADEFSTYFEYDEETKKFKRKA